MAEKPKCALCGKDAIGFQSIGCSYLNMSARAMPTAISLPSDPVKNNRLVNVSSSNGSVRPIHDHFPA
jgi:hypothetical protein